MPLVVVERTGQTRCPIGVVVLETRETRIGFEICEECWQEKNTASLQRVQGAEIIINSSGSHDMKHKVKNKIEMVRYNNSKSGGFYIYNNLIGTDGGRLYYDGQSFVMANKKLIFLNEQFGL